MDNQQERSLVDLGWLAGVWESEGYFGMRLNGSMGRPKYTYLHGFRLDPICGFTNSDPEMIKEVARVLSVNGLAYYIEKPRMREGIGKRPSQELKISGLKRVSRFIVFMLPFIKTKKDRALLLKKYVDYRMSVPSNTPYGIYELYLYDELRKLNNHPPSKSSESIRQTLLSKRSEDVRRPNGRPLEAAEMTARPQGL